MKIVVDTEKHTLREGLLVRLQAELLVAIYWAVGGERLAPDPEVRAS